MAAQPYESQSQFFVSATALSDLAKDKASASLTKRLLPVLEELSTPKCVHALHDGSVDLLSPLLKLLRYDDVRVLSLAHFLASNLLRLRKSPAAHGAIMAECAKVMEVDSLATRTTLLRTVADAVGRADVGTAVPVPAGLTGGIRSTLKVRQHVHFALVRLYRSIRLYGNALDEAGRAQLRADVLQWERGVGGMEGCVRTGKSKKAGWVPRSPNGVPCCFVPPEMICGRQRERLGSYGA